MIKFSSYSWSGQGPGVFKFTIIYNSTTKSLILNISALKICTFAYKWIFNFVIKYPSFSVAKATLQLHMSVCLSVHRQNPSASQNCSYRPSSLSTIKPIDHQAHWPSSGLSYSFATFKPFGLFNKIWSRKIKHKFMTNTSLWNNHLCSKFATLLVSSVCISCLRIHINFRFYYSLFSVP